MRWNATTLARIAAPSPIHLSGHIMQLSNVKIGTRLSIGFAAILIISIASSGVGVWRMRAVAVETRQMAEKPLAKERLVSDWYRNTTSNILRTTAIARAADESLGAFFAADVAATTQAVNGIQKTIEPLLSSAAEKAAYDKVGEVRKRYGTARDASIKAKRDGNAAESMRVLEQDFLPAAKEYGAALGVLLQIQRDSINANARDIEQQYQTGLTLMSTLMLLLSVFGALCAIFLTRSIVTPLLAAVATARKVAAGDLTSTFGTPARDETGQLLAALAEMNGALRSIVGQVRSGTESIATASNEVAVGNLDLSTRTEQQASTLEETAASMEQMTSTVKQNTDNARQANQMAASASQVARQGGALVDQVVHTMATINDSSKQIVDIIGVIDGIAFQTNILALNAAVEAARAGEQGRGFGVVASEVRNLAQRSAAAAKDIKILIGDSVTKVELGSRLVGQAGQTMNEVVVNVQRVNDIMDEITTASHEQEKGIEQINRAIGEMDSVTQQNAALVEQAAAAAESLQDQSLKLAQVVSAFKLDAGGAPRMLRHDSPRTLA